MSVSVPVSVYIEIEKGSTTKYEYDADLKKLIVDRMMPPTHPYPFAYGFFPNTFAADGDELDALIIRTGNDIQNDKTYEVYIIGALVMEDEHGMDEKVLCVLADDYERMKTLNDIPDTIKNTIDTFFSTYKLNVPEKWSKTYGFMNHSLAQKLYDDSLVI